MQADCFIDLNEFQGKQNEESCALLHTSVVEFWHVIVLRTFFWVASGSSNAAICMCVKPWL